MELTPLRYFVKLADVLSFTEAAKELFITQSTLSLSIKQLEEELGVNLFDRIGKKVFLTDAGNDFLACARKALEEVEYGVQHLKEMQHVCTGKVRIGVIYSLFQLLNHCVLNFTRAFPEAELSIVYSHSVLELVELINSNKLDFALSYNPQDVSALTESTEYASLPLCVIAHEHHPVAVRKRFSLADLNEFPLVFLEKELYTRKVIDRMQGEGEAADRSQQHAFVIGDAAHRALDHHPAAGRHGGQPGAEGRPHQGEDRDDARVPAVAQGEEALVAGREVPGRVEGGNAKDRGPQAFRPERGGVGRRRCRGGRTAVGPRQMNGFLVLRTE